MQKQPEINGLERTPQKGDRIEVVKVLILAVVSFALGFGLVIFFLGPGDTASPDDGAREEVVSAEQNRESEGGGAAPTAPGGYAPEGSAGFHPSPAEVPAEQPAAESTGDDVPQGAGMADEASAPAEVPPGKTPENVALDGSAFYLKCWDAKGGEIAGSSCDGLRVLEKRFSTRLYVVDQCKIKHSGEKAEGKLSLGMEVDFANQSLSYWNGASSTLENAASVAKCLRTELNGLPIHSVEHKYLKYRIFFTVLFGKSSAKATTSAAPSAPSKEVKGPTRNVIMDRVRVRRTPVDGEIIGKISSGNQVKLLEKKGAWCRILTPNNNEGWMTCEALSK